MIYAKVFIEYNQILIISFEKSFFVMNPKVIIVRNRRDKNKDTTDGIFALNGGTRSLLIKGEGEEISTAVDVAESLKMRMYPGIDSSNIFLSL